MRSCGVDSSGSGYRPVARSYEHDKEPSVFIKGGEFLDQPEVSSIISKSFLEQLNCHRTLYQGVRQTLYFPIYIFPYNEQNATSITNDKRAEKVPCSALTIFERGLHAVVIPYHLHGYSSPQAHDLNRENSIIIQFSCEPSADL